jgi:multidrug efflux pump subunit AcrA (membrane-fusion protein)
VVLLAAAAAVVAGFVVARPRPAVPFECPMHAEVRSPGPGVCPVCGMALERAAHAPPTAAAPETRVAVTPGELVTVRSRVFSREVRAPARVDEGGAAIVALLHADDLTPARTEEGGVFTPADGAAPPVSIEAVDAPPAAADDTTSWARFHVRSNAPAFAAGTAGWVSWPARPRATLVLPDTAIIRDAEGPYVLVADPGAPLGFERRAVKVGKTFQSLGVVVSGLSPGERVVADGAFSWDAERRLRAGPTAHAP